MRENDKVLQNYTKIKNCKYYWDVTGNNKQSSLKNKIF